MDTHNEQQNEQTIKPASFVDNLSEDVVLAGAAMNGFLQGRDTVRGFLGKIKELYKDFTIVYKMDTETHYIEEYTALIQGHPVTGVATIRRNDKGEFDQVIVNHRPLSSLLLFSTLAAEVTKDVLDRNHFYHEEEQPLADLIAYADQNGRK